MTHFLIALVVFFIAACRRPAQPRDAVLRPDDGRPRHRHGRPPASCRPATRQGRRSARLPAGDRSALPRRRPQAGRHDHRPSTGRRCDVRRPGQGSIRARGRRGRPRVIYVRDGASSTRRRSTWSLPSGRPLIDPTSGQLVDGLGRRHRGAAGPDAILHYTVGRAPAASRLVLRPDRPADLHGDRRTSRADPRPGPRHQRRPARPETRPVSVVGASRIGGESFQLGAIGDASSCCSPAQRLRRRLQPAAAAAAGRRPHRGRLVRAASARGGPPAGAGRTRAGSTTTS